MAVGCLSGESCLYWNNMLCTCIFVFAWEVPLKQNDRTAQTKHSTSPLSLSSVSHILSLGRLGWLRWRHHDRMCCWSLKAHFMCTVLSRVGQEALSTWTTITLLNTWPDSFSYFQSKLTEIWKQQETSVPFRSKGHNRNPSALVWHLQRPHGCTRCCLQWFTFVPPAFFVPLLSMLVWPWRTLLSLWGDRLFPWVLTLKTQGLETFPLAAFPREDRFVHGYACGLVL